MFDLGVTLRREKIEKNPGLRELAKLMLNSFWGYLGMDPSMPQNEFLTAPDRLYSLLSDTSKEVQDAYSVSIVVPTILVVCFETPY